MRVLLFLVLGIACISAHSVRQISSTTATQINTGLTLAKELANFIEKSQFTEALTKLSKAAGPFLGVIGPFVSLVLGFNQESAELKAIKQLFKTVNTRFDQVDHQFSDVKRLINWSSVQVKFGILEQKIHAVSNEFKVVYEVPSAAFKNQKQIFITNYESDYQNSGSKLYDGIMNEGRIFGDGLLDSTMKFTQYDRKKCQSMMLGLLKLLMEASRVELAYYEMKGYHANQLHYKQIWEDRLNKIRSKFSQADHTVASKYHDQADKDIERFAADHPTSSLNNKDFDGALYRMLAAKYYWRDWLVIVYKDISGSDVHYMHECSGFLKFRNHGRNIVVASVDKTKPHISSSTGMALVNRVQTKTAHNTARGRYYYKKSAQDAYNTFPSSARSNCSPYASVGLVAWGSDVWYIAPHGRLFLRDEERYYHVHAFG